MRDRNLERILLGKQVYCKYKSKGYEWKGTLREVDRHCSTWLLCEWCKSALLCYEIEGHNEVCIVANELIECNLQPFGCTKIFPRRSEKVHMQNSCHKHVSLLKEAHEELSKRMAALKSENARLEEINMHMQEVMNTEVKIINEKCKNFQDRYMYDHQQALICTTTIKDLVKALEKTIVNNADTTLLGRIHDLNAERDEITDKLNDSQIEVKLLRSRVRRYRYYAAIIAFLTVTALIVGIILQHYIPTLFNIIVQLLVLVLCLGCPPILFYTFSCAIKLLITML